MTSNYIKRYGFLAVLFAAFVITIAGYTLFSRTEHFQALIDWADYNQTVFVLILLFIKIVGIVWPPLPAAVFTLGSIPVIGWQSAFAVDFAGGIIGSCIAFWLSRKYGPNVIKTLFGESGLQQVQRFKFKPENELEAITLMRFFSGAIAELISYGSGLTNIKFRNFLLGTIFSYMLITLPMFYAVSFVFEAENLLLAVIPIGVGIVLIYSIRHRYFHIE